MSGELQKLDTTLGNLQHGGKPVVEFSLASMPADIIVSAKVFDSKLSTTGEDNNLPLKGIRIVMNEQAFMRHALAEGMGTNPNLPRRFLMAVSRVLEAAALQSVGKPRLMEALISKRPINSLGQLIGLAADNASLIHDLGNQSGEKVMDTGSVGGAGLPSGQMALEIYFTTRYLDLAAAPALPPGRDRAKQLPVVPVVQAKRLTQ